MHVKVPVQIPPQRTVPLRRRLVRPSILGVVRKRETFWGQGLLFGTGSWRYDGLGETHM